MPTDRPAYRPYVAQVASVRILTEHSTRVTFTGADFTTFGTSGLDQRIKIVFPLPGIGVSDFGANDRATIDEGTWYARWRALPDDVRNPFRTYTIRAVRPGDREVDVDFVRHVSAPQHGPTGQGGPAGPAARWLGNATPGDELVIIGPDARSIHAATGLDWHPGCATVLLLAGDETAAPAICSILESLPAHSRARAFIEVAALSDTARPVIPAGCEVTWLARGSAPHGTLLDTAVRGWVADNRQALTASPSAQPLHDIDVDHDLLWDSPAPVTDGNFYAWLAGESAAITRLRRFLVTETWIDRRCVAFMGYWRRGRAEAP
ncbi:siderophore-interacting protein [Cryobacterium sp. MLB-32]|nr:siderophore-interacting protein [Cryobacterium sp. MLB-32]